MTASEYESLSTEQKVAVAEEVAKQRDDAEQFEAIRKKAAHDSETGCYHAIGEPKGAIRCDECCGNIPLETECATIKCFAQSDTEEETGVHWEPRLICLDCAEAARVDAEYKLGVVVRGILDRRRTRPGDPCSAPYVYYIEPDEGFSVDIITSVDGDEGDCFNYL